MSARNGDKSRYQINRKRAIHRRVKIRQLIKSVRSGPAQAAKASPKRREGGARAGAGPSEQ
jgi:hypothetical protein